MTFMKIAFASLLIGGLVDLVGQAFAVAIVTATGLGSLAWLWRHIIRPAAGAFKRTYDAAESLEKLPSFMESTAARLESGDEKFDVLDQRMDASDVNQAEVLNRLEALGRDLGVEYRSDPA